ncbi:MULTISPECIES: sodium:solute symporter family protein [Achromobacter]|uniref:Sodium:solute symporter family protein n=1 Tax=Achromobacter spanius TaxID=217203 RepID=A0ABY8GMG7_9BURK|nr:MULTISPECIES: sodium:solute symporter family protein [Achromobacter]WAI84878.1 sodium:solute symporter family protein [Achromobacter spanius]WEX94961.1 sodium:solute symporter family protein [Achromobacter sp. SS2-2022]WFP05870.1 sodium:solute symporter family protein [Achromobacter spanius]
MQESVFFQLSATTAILLLAGFYGATFLMSLLIGEKNENVDGFMVSNNAVGFGLSAASMIATWIWAASFYASATSGFKYGLSGPLHYGFWGALMILFIYPFGKRFRQLAPKAHTLAEVIHARHGTSSQMIMAVSNILGSCISLMVNFTAAGALVSILSPLTFIQGVLIAGLGVLSYTLWSGFRTSIMTDFAQLAAMIIAAVIIIPLIFFNAGGPDLLQANMWRLSSDQADFYSTKAILEQGAPYFVAVLAYAIGNQTIAQRLFAVREDLIKPTFLTATIGYGAVVIGLGMLGLLALFVGLEPANGDMNNIIPQMASTYLPPFGIALFFLLVVGSLSSTADSDLAALSAIVMTDVYAKNLARGRPDPRRMLWWGRATMIIATMIGVIFASLRLDILVMLVFVGALWGAIVFPVIASFYWDRVNNRAFVCSVLSAVALFTIARFELLPMTGVIAVFFEICAAVGGGVVLGLMTFGFLGRTAAIVVGTIGVVVMLPAFIGNLRDYIVLLASLTAYGASAIVCVALSLRNRERFDFTLLADRVTSFNHEQEVMLKTPPSKLATDAAQ